MRSEEVVIVGLSMLVISALLQLGCMLIMRVLVKLKHGGHISTIRTWLYLSSALEQIAYIVYHVRYNYFFRDPDVPNTCIVLRFLQSFCSTFTAMWLLVISSFYLVLTIKPEKCFTFYSRLLSQCVTWTWTCVSCLLYLVLAFLLKERQHLGYIEKCWDDISGTIHMYSTYGNEIIPLVCAIVFISMARFRISTRRARLGVFMQNSECNVSVDGLFHTVDRYLILLFLMALYYIVLTFRFILDESGSDVTIMICQSSKGLAIALLTCLLDGEVLSGFRGRRPAPPAITTATNGRPCNNGRSNISSNLELNTYTFAQEFNSPMYK